MSTLRAVWATVLLVVILAVTFNFLMGTPAFMDVLLFTTGVALGRYVVVGSYQTYRLMLTLTED